MIGFLKSSPYLYVDCVICNRKISLAHEEGLSAPSYHNIRRGHEHVAVCVPCMREIVESHLNKL